MVEEEDAFCARDMLQEKFLNLGVVTCLHALVVIERDFFAGWDGG